MSPRDLAACKRAGLVDADGRLTYAGRTLVGERRMFEPLASWLPKWQRMRGTVKPNPRPPGFKEEE